MSNLTQNMRVYGTLVARILMGGFFLLAGIGKLQNITGVENMISDAGLPAAMLLAWLTIIIEVVGGAAIILGKKTSKAAILLVVFTLLASIFMHEISFMDMMFMKNMCIIAGLLYMAAYGPGDGWSMVKKSSPAPTSPSPDMSM